MVMQDVACDAAQALGEPPQLARGGLFDLHPLAAEAIHALSPEPSDEHRPRTAGQRFDAVYSDNGVGTGCGGSRLISSFRSLPGLK